MAHPVMWFEVMGKNGNALREFYGSLFQWTFKVSGPAQYGMADTGDVRGIPGGVGHAPAPATPHGVTFYVETPDVAASLAQAEQLGGKTLMPVMKIDDATTIGLFTDPEGHVVGLIQAQAA